MDNNLHHLNRILDNKEILLGDDTWVALSRDWLGWIVLVSFVFSSHENVYRRLVIWFVGLMALLGYGVLHPGQNICTDFVL